MPTVMLGLLKNSVDMYGECTLCDDGMGDLVYCYYWRAVGDGHKLAEN